MRTFNVMCCGCTFQKLWLFVIANNGFSMKTLFSKGSNQKKVIAE